MDNWLSNEGEREMQDCDSRRIVRRKDSAPDWGAIKCPPLPIPKRELEGEQERQRSKDGKGACAQLKTCAGRFSAAPGERERRRVTGQPSFPESAWRRKPLLRAARGKRGKGRGGCAKKGPLTPQPDKRERRTSMARRPASRPLLIAQPLPALATRRKPMPALWWLLLALAISRSADARAAMDKGGGGDGVEDHHPRIPTSSSPESQDGPPSRPKLLVILVQGVRADYIDHGVHPGFARLAQAGIRAEYVLPVFPSSPYPNAYSIATGLYAESHGIVADAMYDAEKRDLFLGAPTAGSSVPWSHWWEGAEPIWLLAERRRLRSAVYWWPGCEVALNETRPAICMPQRPVQGWRALDSDFRRKLDEVLEVFDTDELSLAMLQYGAVAYFGRHRGPESKERHKALAEFDHHLNYLIDRLEILNLTQKVTLMVVSDHGMANTGPESTTEIVLDKYSSFIKYMLNFGSHSMVLPWKDMFRPLHRALIDARVEGLQVYTKEEIPARYHIKHSPRVLPLFLMTTPKYFIFPLSDSSKTKVSHKKRFFGYHGYDPELPEMRTIFYAQGPRIKRNYVLKPLVNVDHYNFMCHALGLEPKPNNGSWARMDEGLVESEMDFPRYGSSKYSNAAEPTGSLTRRPLASWPPALELLALVAAAIVAPACARHAL